MNNKFNEEEALKNLRNMTIAESQALESERIETLKHVTSVLKEVFAGSDVVVILIGSILQPNKFRKTSDVDIVLKNFKGDRFDLWAKLEEKIHRKVEVILYENCSFKDHVDKYGLRLD